MQMNSHQQAVLNAVTSGGNVVVNAGPGTGKGLRSDQPVITPKGYVAIGNLKSGDLVYGPDGHTYPVVGVYHRGVLPLYEVKFNDGQSVITDGDHRWLCKTLRERKRDRQAVIRTTSELIKLGKNVFLPMPKPLLGNSVTRVIDPWLIGALLGDGGMSGTAVVFSNSEDSMLSAVRDTLPKPCQLKYIANYDWKISGNGKGSYNQVVDALRYLKLFGCRSHEKFVPEHLLNADVQTRTSILQGLLDTDGSTDGYAVEYCSSSKQLALDVIRIVESLGGLCTMKEKPSHYTKSDGSRVDCKVSYRVSIRLPSTISPFKHSEKKLFRYVPKTKYQPARQIVSITSVDPGESVCIEVGSPDHLFLTVGHAVTHNTYVLAGTANANQGKPIINFCFNRNTKLQADERMPSWVKNYTFHGAAYGQVGKYYQKQLNTKLSPRVISQHFDCDEKDATVVKYTLRKFATSDSNCITGWNVPFESFKGKPKQEQEQYKEQIVTLSRRVWNECMMKKNPKFGVEHDMYLKLWEMEGARVSGRFEMVMVDESQDMVPVNISALRKIYGQRICVGDARQELYAFRQSEDVRKSMTFEHELHLVESKRFGQAIADVANKVQVLLPDTYPPIIGAGGESKVLSGQPKGQYAVLCRSNLGLLSEAIKAIDDGKTIHVIGSLTESIMLMESAWYLFLGETRKVIHPSLRMAGDWETLVELAKEDQEFAMAVKRVEEFRGQIPFICEKVKMAGETSRQRAEVVLSTVHKCVHPDTLVETPNGLMKIRDIPNEGEIATPLGMTSSYHDWFTREESDTLAITTKRGYQIEITTDHGMTVWEDGEHVRKNGSELEVGDWLRVRVGMTCDVNENPSLPVFNEVLDVRSVIHRLPETMNESFAEFLGLMVADGTIYNRGFKLLKKDRDVVDRFRDLVYELFGYEAKFFENEGTPGYDVGSIHIATWLKRSFNGLCPNSKAIPDIILRSPLRIQAAFLKGLFEDGTVNIKAGQVDHIHFDSKFEGLARTVQTMLLRFEIISSINTHTTRDPLTITTLYIYGENMRTFRDRIGFVSGRKCNKLDDLPKFKKSLDCIPITTKELKSLRNLTTLTEYQNARARQRISRHKAARLIERAGQDESVSFLIERMRWHYEKITSITASRSETICVTVPDGNRFLQNGFDGWNSKGDEFDVVKLGDDFPDLVRFSKKERKYTAMTSEICCFFVAVTRAKRELYANTTLSQLDTWKEWIS